MSKRENVSKIYCEKCDLVFSSKKKYVDHLSRHSSSASYESCPVDTILGKIFGLFKRSK